MSEPIDILNRVRAALSIRRYSYAGESMLHEGIKQVLTEAGLHFTHEHASGRDRFDFLLEGGVVIEIKVGGTLQSALAQVARYIQREDITAVALVAITPWARTASREFQLSGKPGYLVPLQRKAF